MFAEPARNWLLRAKLRVSFKQEEDCVARTPTGGGSDAVYIRLKVVNERRRMARSCRAFLVKVEKQTRPGVYENTIYADSLQLAWSCQARGEERRPMDLIHGVSQYVDVISTVEINNTFEVHVAPMPLRYRPLFSAHAKTLRLTIQVSGDGVDPQLIRIVFAWKGNWEKADIYEDPL